MIYGVSPFIQKDLVDKHCFGDCGKIQCAGADGCESIGPVFLCLHADCPHEEKCSPVMGDINGEEFKVRKLR